MYSTVQFWRDWRFAIDKDFVKPSGSPFDYAHNGLQEWGDECLKIPFSANWDGRRSAALSDDGRYLAMNSKYDVIVWDILEPKQTHVLQGHTSSVDFIAFRPGHPTQLVSSAQEIYYPNKGVPEIIFWDLTKSSENPNVTQYDVERVARNTANALIAELKEERSPIQLNARDQKTFAKTMEDPIWTLVRQHAAADNEKLSGRLAGNFAPQIFSPSGKYLCYMPGEAPGSNGDADWEFRLYAVDEHKDALVLSGNRDSIMWMGFNHDETLVASSSWDKSFRIWDIKTGELKRHWTTQGQNWAAAFSPDGKLFAGTSGDDNLYVYNISDGSQHMIYNYGLGWCRALSWHPSEPLIAVGGEGYGKLYLIDVRINAAVQHRLLSSKATKLPDDIKGWDPCSSQLEITDVQFVDNGRKIAFYTSGDGSAEVYDIAECVKWRFARWGTMNPPEDHTPVISQGGFNMIARDDQNSKEVVVASVDKNSVRLWKVPMSS